MKYIKKISIILALFFVVSCFNSFKNQIDSKEDSVLLYKKDDVTLELEYLDKERRKIQFNLSIDSIGLFNLQGIADLILIEDVDGKLIVPEGTNRTDYNNPDDIWGMGYQCDSTYSYDADTLKIDFAMESTIKRSEYAEPTKHRLDFSFYRYNKNEKILKNTNKTLLLVSQKNN